VRVVVVGAGVVGLTCAVRLAEAGHEAHVLARDLPPETTSAVAAALWYPYRALPQDRVTAWSARTYQVLTELARQPGTGVRIREGVELLGPDAPDLPWWRAAVPGLTTVPDPAPGYRRGWRLVRREYPTAIGPVDILARDAVGATVAIEIKRRGEIDGVEQLTRYLELLNRDSTLRPVRGLFAAQEIKPQARVLATDRGIDCVTLDYDALRGFDDADTRLF
jgi:hypothetical protein